MSFIATWYERRTGRPLRPAPAVPNPHVPAETIAYARGERPVTLLPAFEPEQHQHPYGHVAYRQCAFCGRKRRIPTGGILLMGTGTVTWGWLNLRRCQCRKSMR